MAKRKAETQTINDIKNGEYAQEILKLTLSINFVADKIDDDLELTRGEKNLAKNVLKEYAEKLLKLSGKGLLKEKSADPSKTAHRESVLRYRVKKHLERLTQGEF